MWGHSHRVALLFCKLGQNHRRALLHHNQTSLRPGSYRLRHLQLVDVVQHYEGRVILKNTPVDSPDETSPSTTRSTPTASPSC
jgi:hypothetical protein